MSQNIKDLKLWKHQIARILLFNSKWNFCSVCNNWNWECKDCAGYLRAKIKKIYMEVKYNKWDTYDGHLDWNLQIIIT